MTLTAELKAKIANTSAITDLIGASPVRARAGGKLAQNETYPALGYFLVTETPNPAHGTAQADDKPYAATYQFDCWATTYTSAVALADAVVTALSRWSLIGGAVNVRGSRLTGLRDAPYEPETKTFRRMVDIEFFYD